MPKCTKREEGVFYRQFCLGQFYPLTHFFILQQIKKCENRYNHAHVGYSAFVPKSDCHIYQYDSP